MVLPMEIDFGDLGGDIRDSGPYRKVLELIIGNMWLSSDDPANEGSIQNEVTKVIA